MRDITEWRLGTGIYNAIEAMYCISISCPTAARSARV